MIQSNEHEGRKEPDSSIEYFPYANEFLSDIGYLMGGFGLQESLEVIHSQPHTE